MRRKKTLQIRGPQTNTNSRARDGGSVIRAPRAISAGQKNIFRTTAAVALAGLGIAILALGCAGCAKHARPAGVMRNVPRGYSEQGIASWYGEPYHGRPTASGEIYDMHQLTAAHRRLPFDTVARIEHRGNGRSVEVRINDRGSFAAGRVLDLSRAAAARLGMEQQGTAKIKLRVVTSPRPAEFSVQAASFHQRASAEEFCRTLRGRFPSLRIVASGGTHAGPGFRVVMRGGSREEAERWRRELIAAGVSGAFVVPLSRERD